MYFYHTCDSSRHSYWHFPSISAYFSERLPDLSEQKYEQVHSSIDYDRDGVDDQADILQGALDYINTRPKYKSKYYNSGYPNDNYGVCTDIVAKFAMQATGYELMQLVNEDIQNHPTDYDIQEPDQNIDFRRVKKSAGVFCK